MKFRPYAAKRSYINVTQEIDKLLGNWRVKNREEPNSVLESVTLPVYEAVMVELTDRMTDLPDQVVGVSCDCLHLEQRSKFWRAH